MSDSPTTWQTIGGIGGLVSVLTVIGAGWRWIFNRADRREAALDKREARQVAKMEERVAALEARDERRETEVIELRTELTETRTELSDTRTALLVLAQEVAEHNPTSAALALARNLLRGRFPLDPNTPDDMIETARRAV